jgi:hypothetical protein
MKERLKKFAATIAAQKRLIAAVTAFIVSQVILIIWIFQPETEIGNYLRFFVGCLITAIFASGWGFCLKYGRILIDSIWAVLKVVMLAYLEVKEKESKRQITDKTTKAGIKWISYFLSDWGVEIIIVSTIGALKYHNCSWNETFMVVWTIDTIVGLIFIFISKKVIDDFMLMAAYRRAFDTLYGISKQAGSLFLVYSLVKFSFWDGSEVATMFFEKELNTTIKKILSVMFFSSLRIFLLVEVFNVGYYLIN